MSSEVNRRMWDERAPAHAAAPEYGLARFASDPDHLSDVVRFDRPRLGDISGLRGVHLQCHIGTDTVSLSRLGARMSGLDFSAAAISVADDLAKNAGADIDFHVADVYDSVEVLGAGGYDLVFTGIGALGWLPDMERWARSGGRPAPTRWPAVPARRPSDDVVPGRPAARRSRGGRVSLLHPGRADGLGRAGHLRHHRVAFVNTVSHEWSHGLGEVTTALLNAGMVITAPDRARQRALGRAPGRDGPDRW